jgi:sigma-B regulation protein RsbU (phosphoserine phosphatase)
MEVVNNDFRSIFGARSFMTAMCVALDPESGRATVVGAGHPPLLIIRSDGATESFRSSAPPLGLVEQSEFTQIKIDLKPGDAFLLYTDGLYGAADGKKQRLNPEHLAELLQPRAPSAQALLNGILERLAPDQGNEPLADDVAALVVRRSG